MKKISAFLLVLVLTATLIGCEKKNDGKTKKTNGQSVSDIIQQQMDKEDGVNATITQNPEPPEKTPSSGNTVQGDVDVDLTTLSSTLVYSEVYNMLTSPDDYIGKTVKMKGLFSLYYAYDENDEIIPNQIYYACVIADATACCQQGMEFILGNDAKYPDDYPAEDTEITVVGEFRTYMEGPNMYCHLVNAQWIE